MQPYDDLSLSKDQYQVGWLEAYKHQKEDFLWQEDPIVFLPNYVKGFQENGVRSILDAGCGDGRNVLYLLREKFFVVGVDLSPIALTAALNLASRQSQQEVCFVHADLESLPDPFPANSFDALTCLDVFGQVLKVDRVIEGFQKIVRQNGFILLNLYTPDDAAFGIGQQLDEKSFLYKETLFRFFTEQDVKVLFGKFDILKIEKLRWEDPPHPGYRDDYHTHDSLVVLLQNR